MYQYVVAETTKVTEEKKLYQRKNLSADKITHFDFDIIKTKTTKMYIHMYLYIHTYICIFMHTYLTRSLIYL